MIHDGRRIPSPCHHAVQRPWRDLSQKFLNVFRVPWWMLFEDLL